MAITVPPIFSGILDNEVTYKHSVSEETVRKMVQNTNLLGKLSPIGSIRMIQFNAFGVHSPDPTLMQLCNASEIVDPNSPLRTMGIIQHFTPNLLGLYPRGAANALSNPTGGAPTVNLSHSHGGSTGSLEGSIVGEEGEEKTARVNHSHPINPDLNGAEPLDPSHQVLAWYLKIN